MKKSLVALAALAATSVFAQSAVTIDGNVDAGFQAVNQKGTKVSGIGGNGSSTSGLNFRVTEDLGGGLKANFRYETNWNMAYNAANTGTANVSTTDGATVRANSAGGSFGNGEIRLGVSGGFGAVDMGVVNYNGLTSFGTGNPFGTAAGGGYGSITRVDSAGTRVRSDNSVKFTSPTFSGVNVTLYKANKQTKGTNNASDFSSTLARTDMGGAQELGLNYANGPLAVSFSALTQDNVGISAVVSGAAPADQTTETKLNTLGANYTLGAAKLFFLNQTHKNTGATTTATTIDTSYNSVAASYTMGATTFMLQAGKLKADAGTNAGKSSSLTGAGADYALSKRTTAYFRHESINDKAGVVAITGFPDKTTDIRTRTHIGVRHAF